MFFLLLLTSVMSSEYLVCLLMRAQILLFLGPEDSDFANTLNKTKEAEIELFFNGTFYLDSSENFEPYLTELGVGYFLRQLAMLAFPIVTVARTCPAESSHPIPSLPDPCTWSIKTDAAVRTHVITFQLGEEVEDFTMDGRSIKTVFTRPSWNRLVEEQVGDTVNTTLLRDFFQDKMEVTMHVNNVTASSVFRRN